MKELPEEQQTKLQGCYHCEEGISRLTFSTKTLWCRNLVPNFCPMCGRKLKEVEDK